MKSKRNEKIVSLLLATVMLFSLLLPVYAEESEEKTAQVFAEVDFEEVRAIGTSIDPASAGMSEAHPYVSRGGEKLAAALEGKL